MPNVNSPSVRNEIDAFIVEKLRELKIEPSPEASRSTLIRRVYLDVLGLPPTPAEVDAFVADHSPDAYEKMVDRALASPHYGERWGRHWLDQARYADTNGYSVDAERSMWPYRDWVIQALNDDMPFDQFTIEQLAGDLLPNPTQRAAHRHRLSSQYADQRGRRHRRGAISRRGGRRSRQHDRHRLAGPHDRLRQCHTHKFDPISQHEYYQLFAFFNNCEDANTRPPILNLATPKQQKKLDELDKQIGAAKEAIAAYDRKHGTGRQCRWKTQDASRKIASR